MALKNVKFQFSKLIFLIKYIIFLYHFEVDFFLEYENWTRIYIIDLIHFNCAMLKNIIII